VDCCDALSFLEALTGMLHVSGQSRRDPFREEGSCLPWAVGLPERSGERRVFGHAGYALPGDGCS
jgi:hypothetical protein